MTENGDIEPGVIGFDAIQIKYSNIKYVEENYALFFSVV